LSRPLSLDTTTFVSYVAQLAGEGYGAHNIAAILECADKTVRRYARLHGIALPKRTRTGLANWSGFPPEAIAKAAAKRWRYVEWSGGRERLIDAAARLGITVDCLRERLKKWDVEKAMTTPLLPAFHRVEARKVSREHPWLGRRASSVHPA